MRPEGAVPAQTPVDSFLQKVRSKDFPCVGAKAAANSNEVAFRTYGEGTTAANAQLLGADLRDFTRRQCGEPSQFSVLAACFTEWRPETEADFERSLWSLLNELHKVDEDDWDEKYNDNPKSSAFKFSFASRAYYVVGLNPLSNRAARRFSSCFLIFNPVWQFELLRERKLLDRMVEIIRRRDVALQGSAHPNLKYEGILSDAVQYAGNVVGPDWTCPFTPQRKGRKNAGIG